MLDAIRITLSIALTALGLIIAIFGPVTALNYNPLQPDFAGALVSFIGGACLIVIALFLYQGTETDISQK